MSDTPENLAAARSLRVLMRLVTVLTLVMILGLMVVIGLMVAKLGQGRVALPAEIALPEGATASAITAGPGWYAVVTTAGEILIYEAASGALRQRVTIDPAP
jgi:hypothetical protein